MSTDENRIRFHQLLEIVLNDLLKSFLHKPLTPELMHSMRRAIREKIHDVFAKSKHRLSDNAETWLTDQYFKRIKFNDDYAMVDQVVINEYKLPELEFNDILLMRNLFIETDMGEDLDKEFKRRGMS